MNPNDCGHSLVVKYTGKQTCIVCGRVGKKLR